jgi:7-cyano-7-deazaguanine reductase
MTSSVDTGQLSVLGATVRHPIDHVECFPAPEHVTTVRFTTDEVMSLCPVTGQPDLSSLAIEYQPDQRCVESKSLKLYLWSFRERKVFAEALAAEVAGEIMRAAEPHQVRVTLTQHARGGIVVEATAERHRGDAGPAGGTANGEATADAAGAASGDADGARPAEGAP